MKIRLGSAALAAMFGLIAPIVVSAATLSLPTGSEMSVTIDQTLDSHSAQAGDKFTAHVVPPYPFGNNALNGAVVTGEIVSVQHS